MIDLFGEHVDSWKMIENITYFRIDYLFTFTLLFSSLLVLKAKCQNKLTHSRILKSTGRRSTLLVAIMDGGCVKLAENA